MSGYCICKEYDFTGDAVGVARLFKDESFAFVLESGLPRHATGRFSFIGFDPCAVFNQSGPGAHAALKTFFKNYAGPVNGAPPFLSAGLIGYLSYDFGLHVEGIRRFIADDLGLPECLFGMYDCIIAIDHHANTLYVTSTGLPETVPHLRRARAHKRMQKIIGKLSAYLPDGNSPYHSHNGLAQPDAIGLALESSVTPAQYMQAVKKALEYIADGDIYQVNLSQRFACDVDTASTHPFETYAALRAVSPSNFGGYFDCGDFQIISGSPERFVRLQGDVLETRPMKGTRPRHADPAQDQQLRKDLLCSPKDRAELLMITDLERNDLGRVCEYGSVHVKEMRTLEEYETVFQTTATVQGMLKKGADCFDVIRTCFPGGSITGCPKIRSMEIIEELEPVRRGLYTGSLGYIDCGGNMDFNILIRTLIARRDRMYFHVGGGIVADSTPENEYQETIVKSQAMQRALMQVLRPAVGV